MHKPWIRRVIILAVIGFLLSGGFIGVVLTTDILVNQFEEVEPAIYYQSQQFIQKDSTGLNQIKIDSFKVMSWNIKFGGGRIDFFFDCYGDRVLMEKSEVISNLENLAQKIKQYQPDVLFIQEADIASKRSADVDMVQWLLDHTDLNYGVYASQWEVAWIPSKGLGNMNSGNAILSRWKLKNAQRIALPQMPHQDPVTRFFYLRRNFLIANMILPGTNKEIKLLNTHIVAYDKSGTRKIQLKMLADKVQQLTQNKETIIFGGDFNTLPPGTKKVKDFDDSVCKDDDFVSDDYSQELEYLRPFYQNYQEIIPLENYQADESMYYTHTVDGRGFWGRRLDYLFTNGIWKHGMVHQDTASGGMPTMPLSDHAPITGTFFWQ